MNIVYKESTIKDIMEDKLENYIIACNNGKVVGYDSVLMKKV